MFLAFIKKRGKYGGSLPMRKDNMVLQILIYLG